MPSASPPPLIQRRYRLAEWLGQGAMGVVFRAEDETLSRPVVIKFLALQPGSSEAQIGRERFLREARTVARLTHPNIVAIYDVGEQEGWSYLVLEYLPGGDLHKLRRQRGGALPIPEALDLARQILEALAYAHEQGVIHRDIKPDNILLTPQGQAKVADFGLALSHGDARLTQSGAIVGTTAYLPPEAVSGSGVDARGDLYACGAVLYELLTGRPPFEGDNPLSIIAQMAHAELPAPRSLNPEISPTLEEVLLRLLSREPAARFASAAETLAALEHAAALPTLAEAVPGVLLLNGAGGSAALLENERRRLAGLLEESIIEPVNLLLAQVNTFEQTLSSQPSARMAVSVLGALARQVLQQVRDLEASLHPAVLESLGLEPALEVLAERIRRTRGLDLKIEISRLPSRPPANQELALFRLAQELLEALASQHALHALLRLYADSQSLILDIIAPTGSLSSTAIAQARQELQSLGASLVISRSASGELRLSAYLPLPVAALNFTPREMQVLQCLVEGLENKAIAARLVISPRTVSYHLDNIFAKLGVRSRTEAAVLALRRGYARRPSQPV